MESTSERTPLLAERSPTHDTRLVDDTAASVVADDGIDESQHRDQTPISAPDHLFWSLLRDSIPGDFHLTARNPLSSDRDPVILSYILQNSIQTVSIVIAGRLGPDELSVAAFSLMLAFVTG
jgi:MATE family multidrug resistance protein